MMPRSPAVLRPCVLALTFATLAACGGSRPPTVTQADADRVQARWPGVTADELNRGRDLFATKCGSCHVPPAPTDFVADDWPAHVEEMRERAGLDDASAQLVERYLMTMARR
jgi:cytochrome c5